MPNRILKDSICTSDNLDALTPFQETFFYRLIVNCDDFGRMDARPKILSSALFPLKSTRLEDITKALQALSSAELVILYEVDGKPFLQMKSWERHQKIRALRSRYPAPDGDNARLLADDGKCMHMHADDGRCSRNPIQKESEYNPNPCEKEKRTRFTPPTPEEVRSYCQEHGYTSVDAERFCDFYASKGWKVGNQPMKDWQAAVRTWATREASQPASPPARGPKILRDQQYSQREYTNNLDALNEMMRRYAAEGGSANE